MQLLRKWFTLRLLEWRLLMEALLLLVTMRAVLWFWPWPAVQLLVQHYSTRQARSTAIPSVERMAWAITTVRRFVPRATCLTQALAMCTLLERYGYPALLQIGVARHSRDRLEAHAWVESDGVVVLGGTSEFLARYTQLPLVPPTRTTARG